MSNKLTENPDITLLESSDSLKTTEDSVPNPAAIEWVNKVSIKGLPNAGKSSLMNHLIGMQVAGVSRKAHTTQSTLDGVLHKDGCEFHFIDSPGYYLRRGGAQLNRSASNFARRQREVNRKAHLLPDHMHTLLYLADMQKGLQKADLIFIGSALQSISSENAEMETVQGIVIALSQYDRIKDPVRRNALFHESLALLSENLPITIDALGNFTLDANPSAHSAGDATKPGKKLRGKVLPITIKKQSSMDTLTQTLKEFAVPGEPQFDDESVTSLSVRSICEEYIRESCFRFLGKEIPYQLSIKIIDFKEPNLKNKKSRARPIYRIKAVISSPRKQIKPIVLGKSGRKIAEIGKSSRLKMEKLLDCQVFLNLEFESGSSFHDLEIQEPLGSYDNIT